MITSGVNGIASLLRGFRPSLPPFLITDSVTFIRRFLARFSSAATRVSFASSSLAQKSLCFHAKVVLLRNTLHDFAANSFGTKSLIALPHCAKHQRPQVLDDQIAKIAIILPSIFAMIAGTYFPAQATISRWRSRTRSATGQRFRRRCRRARWSAVVKHIIAAHFCA
jgi:hypothetical protein